MQYKTLNMSTLGKKLHLYENIIRSGHNLLGCQFWKWLERTFSITQRSRVEYHFSRGWLVMWAYSLDSGVQIMEICASLLDYKYIIIKASVFLLCENNHKGLQRAKLVLKRTRVGYILYNNIVYMVTGKT